MKVTIDQDKCVAAGQCVMAAAEVFDQRDEDGIVVLSSTTTRRPIKLLTSGTPRRSALPWPSRSRNDGRRQGVAVPEHRNSPLPIRKESLVKSLLWFFLAFGAIGSLSVSRFLQGTDLTMATVTMLVISLVAGSALAQMEPLKSFLAQRKVLWFLFVFNLNAAVAAYLFLGGTKGLMTAIGLGVVALGSGGGLVMRGRKPEAA